MEGGGIPGLNLSAGPSAADTSSGYGATGTGDFFFKQGKGMDQFMPLLALAGILWIIMRK